MKHYMKLNKKPFEMIANGQKTIELRLFDEKRALFNVGDEIEFTMSDNSNYHILVVITAIYRFDSFDELYKNLPKTSIGYLPEEKADPNDMIKYYSVEKQKKYGVVGIEISLIS